MQNKLIRENFADDYIVAYLSVFLICDPATNRLNEFNFFRMIVTSGLVLKYLRFVKF
jgi:hypothetical protein